MGILDGHLKSEWEWEKHKNGPKWELNGNFGWEFEEGPQNGNQMGIKWDPGHWIRSVFGVARHFLTLSPQGVTILRGVPGRQQDVTFGRNLASLFRGSASLFRG